MFRLLHSHCLSWIHFSGSSPKTVKVVADFLSSSIFSHINIPSHIILLSILECHHILFISTGAQVSWFSALFLNIVQMTGTGVNQVVSLRSTKEQNLLV